MIGEKIMENNINNSFNNGIKVNVTGYNYTRQEEAAAQSAPEQKGKTTEKENKHLAANDVLGYMAAANADLIPAKVQRTVDVKKYVTADQEKRIGEFIKGFQADYDNAAAVAASEFGVDEKVAGEIALAYINASY